jgi:hypothetical protein
MCRVLGDQASSFGALTPATELQSDDGAEVHALHGRRNPQSNGGATEDNNSASPRHVCAGQTVQLQGEWLRGEGSNLQHPAPKADVLPIELPRKDPLAALLVPASGP